MKWPTMVLSVYVIAVAAFTPPDASDIAAKAGNFHWVWEVYENGTTEWTYDPQAQDPHDLSPHLGGGSTLDKRQGYSRLISYGDYGICTSGWSSSECWNILVEGDSHFSWGPWKTNGLSPLKVNFYASTDCSNYQYSANLYYCTTIGGWTGGAIPFYQCAYFGLC